MSVNVAPFWIQMYGIPLEALNTKSAEKIGGRWGYVIEAKDPFYEGQLLRSFLRVRVEIDIPKPLSTSFWVPRRDKDKGNVWVCLKYERLQGFYYNRGCIGHDQRICKEEKAMLVLNPSLPRYGLELGVPAAQRLESIRWENSAWKVKGHKKEEEGKVREGHGRMSMWAKSNQPTKL